MKVITQLGLLDIKPESVVAIRQAPVMPESLEFSDLTHCIEFDDRFYSLGDNVVCISEADAEKLSELAGVEIIGTKSTKKSRIDESRYPDNSQTSKEPKPCKTIFVPFRVQLSLSEWENHFDDNIAWRMGMFQKPDKEPPPTPSSLSSDGIIQDEGNRQSKSLIEQAFQAQENGPA